MPIKLYVEVDTMTEPDSSVRMPKGILKNKYGGSSGDPRTDNAGMNDGNQMGYSTGMNYGVNMGQSGVPGWDHQLGMMGGTNKSAMPVAPVPAPQHGMNMPNPVLDPVIRGIK